MKDSLEKINAFLFNERVGVIAWDNAKQTSYFQYDKSFIDKYGYNLFPNLAKTLNVQVFKLQNNLCFKGLPSVFADSLPDDFGNALFNNWLQKRRKSLADLSPIDRLKYIGNRGMGAIEYRPAKPQKHIDTIDVDEIMDLTEQIVNQKISFKESSLDDAIERILFNIGTSMGGARPKLIIAIDDSGNIRAGDVTYQGNHNYYLIKLSTETNKNACLYEYAYYELALKCGIEMKKSELNNGRFITERFDRNTNGSKIHTLTMTGISGKNYQLPGNRYEDIFQLIYKLKMPFKNIEKMYRIMLFNIMFFNIDDHLKNYSFQYNLENNEWNISPAYDLTYPLNPLDKVKYSNYYHAISFNGKRGNFELKELIDFGKYLSINNAKGIIEEFKEATNSFPEICNSIGIGEEEVRGMMERFVVD